MVKFCCQDGILLPGPKLDKSAFLNNKNSILLSIQLLFAFVAVSQLVWNNSSQIRVDSTNTIATLCNKTQMISNPTTFQGWSLNVETLDYEQNWRQAGRWRKWKLTFSRSLAWFRKEKIQIVKSDILFLYLYNFLFAILFPIFLPGIIYQYVYFTNLSQC